MAGNRQQVKKNGKKAHNLRAIRPMPADRIAYCGGIERRLMAAGIDVRHRHAK